MSFLNISKYGTCGEATRFFTYPQYGNKNIGQLLKQAGVGLALLPYKADGVSKGVNAPFTNPWVDVSGNANNATLTNFAGTTADGWDNQAIISSVGMDVAYDNLVVNGNFANGNTGWSSLGGINNVLSKIFIATGNGLQPTITANPTSPISIIASETFNGKIRVRVRGVGCTNLRIRFIAGFKDVNIPNPIVDQWYNIVELATAGSTISATSISVMATYPDNATQNGKQVEVDGNYGVLFHKLTGNTVVQSIESQLGRQLTVAECDRIFPFVVASGVSKVGIMPFLKFDALNSYGILANNPSIDITGTDEFDASFVLLSPSTLATGEVLFYGLDGALLTTQLGITHMADGSILFRLGGVEYTIAPIGTILANSINLFEIYRKTGRLICKLNNVEIYNQPNVVSITTQPNKKIGARSSIANGTTHNTYSNQFSGGLLFTKNPTDWAKLDKVTKEAFKGYL